MEDGKYEKLKELLVNLEDWEKTPTNIPGIKIIKIPAKKDIPERLGIEINPVDESGKIIKKSGAIVLTNEELYQKYLELFDNEKVKELIKEIEFLRNQQQEKQNRKEAIFEL